MMPLLEFVLDDLGHFIGAVILLCLIGSFFIEIANLFRGSK